MKQTTILAIALSIAFSAIVQAQPQVETKNSNMKEENKMNAEKTVLTSTERYLSTLGAFGAVGNQEALKQKISQALDAGVEISQIKEIFIQMYAYCGFPRSLNALSTLLSVAKERGISLSENDLPALVAEGKSLEIGTQNQTKLVGAPVKGELFDFAPAIDKYLKAHLFGDIFSRSALDWKTRELVTISMLASVPGLESQLYSHINIGKRNGLTDAQIAAIFDIVCNEVKGGANTSAFPFGKENTGFAQYFSGRSWLAPLTSNKELGVPVFNVTFEPSCRNNWHSHTGGQMLIAVGGVGFYQERGKPARRLVPGDIVEIAPNVEHWHGAAPDEWFSHLAVECNPTTNKNTWLEPVSNKDYATATKL